MHYTVPRLPSKSERFLRFLFVSSAIYSVIALRQGEKRLKIPEVEIIEHATSKLFMLAYFQKFLLAYGRFNFDNVGFIQHDFH